MFVCTFGDNALGVGFTFLLKSFWFTLGFVRNGLYLAFLPFLSGFSLTVFERLFEFYLLAEQDIGDSFSGGGSDPR